MTGMWPPLQEPQQQPHPLCPATTIPGGESPSEGTRCPSPAPGPLLGVPNGPQSPSPSAPPAPALLVQPYPNVQALTPPTPGPTPSCTTPHAAIADPSCHFFICLVFHHLSLTLLLSSQLITLFPTFLRNCESQNTSIDSYKHTAHLSKAPTTVTSLSVILEDLPMHPLEPIAPTYSRTSLPSFL